MHFGSCIALTGVLLVAACDSPQPAAGPEADLSQSSAVNLAYAPSAAPFGASMAVWEERWWQWGVSVPASVNPGFDPTGANCGQGQNDPNVWYLASTFSTGQVARSCTVPHGRALLVALSTLLNDFPCPDPNFKPGPGQSLAEFLRSGAEAVENTVTALSLSVDGQNVRELFAFRVHTPLFNFTADPSLIPVLDPCFTGTSQPAVADGFLVMLKPLAPGNHTVVFGASTPNFQTTISYAITVEEES